MTRISRGFTTEKTSKRPAERNEWLATVYSFKKTYIHGNPQAA